MKNRRATKPDAVVMVGARAVGIAPTRSKAAKVFLGPNLSQALPAPRRTIKLQHSQSILIIYRPCDSRSNNADNIGPRNIRFGEFKIPLDRFCQLFFRSADEKYLLESRGGVPMVETHTWAQSVRCLDA